MSTMTPAQLRAIDRRIAEAVIDEALRLNYLISVHDGEVFALTRSKDTAAVLAAMFSTDMDTLKFRDGNTEEAIGWVDFIYGNSGWDVIANSSANPLTDALLAPAEKLANDIAEGRA